MSGAKLGRAFFVRIGALGGAAGGGKPKRVAKSVAVRRARAAAAARWAGHVKVDTT